MVNIVSMTAFRSTTIVPGYSAAKAGAAGAHPQPGVHWVDDGIRVNAVAPGLIDTPMTAPMKAYPRARSTRSSAKQRDGPHGHARGGRRRGALPVLRGLAFTTGRSSPSTADTSRCEAGTMSDEIRIDDLADTGAERRAADGHRLRRDAAHRADRRRRVRGRGRARPGSTTSARTTSASGSACNWRRWTPTPSAPASVG